MASLSYSYELKTGDTVLVRPATLADAQSMGALTAHTWIDTPVENFCFPRHREYPHDHIVGHQQHVRARMLNPRMVSIVAALASKPDNIIAFAQFSRLGDDDGARRQIAARETLWLRVQRWWFWGVDKITNWLSPNRSEDPIAQAQFEQWADEEDERHWLGRKDLANRWHVNSVFVGKDWQGKGVGKRLMEPVLQRAREEHVVAELTASPQGEKMYERVGFKLKGRFAHPVDGDGEGGGIMIWIPDGWKGDEGVK